MRIPGRQKLSGGAGTVTVNTYHTGLGAGTGKKRKWLPENQQWDLFSISNPFVLTEKHLSPGVLYCNYNTYFKIFIQLRRG